MIRNRFILRLKIIQGVFIALMIALIYRDLPGSSDNFTTFSQNAIGVLFFITVNMVMSSSFPVLNVFAEEKTVFIREHGNGYYSVG